MSEIFVHCVYGDSDADHIEKVLIPSLIESTSLKLNLRFLNYTPGSRRVLRFEENHLLTIETLLSESGSAKGFAENHNTLFNKFAPAGKFVIINPDCIAADNLLDVLIQRFEREPELFGLVEASQWPYEHPKEFDKKTGETPWASGACVLVNSKFYAENGGMEEGYFLYAEDVDLSWACWLSGYKVIHEELAKVIHFTNGPHESEDAWSLEYLYGLRNHVWLLEKYFGVRGRKKALSQVKAQAHHEVFAWVNQAVNGPSPISPSKFTRAELRRVSQIKVLGKGLYHKMGAS